jgi:hypothetical protein
MGWLDNLETDLSAARNIDDDQPGPSGVTRENIIIFNPEEAIEMIENTRSAPDADNTATNQDSW